jgi:hypothetical protein
LTPLRGACYKKPPLPGSNEPGREEAAMKGKSSEKKPAKGSKKGVSVKTNIKAGTRRIWTT